LSVFVVDTKHDISELFRQLTDHIKDTKINAECILDDYITISAKNENEFLLKDTLAKVASDFILDSIEEEKIRKIISSYRFPKNEASQIIKEIKEDNGSKYKRGQILNNSLQKHLNSSSRLNVDGMVDFRLNEYKSELMDDVENHIDEFMASKAYDEFLDLLKYFVSLQDSKLEIVHVTGNEIDGYVLMDKFLKPIDEHMADDFMAEMNVAGLKHDDILISRLISLSPHKIILHGLNEEKPIITTLKKIFNDKLQCVVS